MSGYFEPNKEAQLNVSKFSNKIFIFNNGAGKDDVVNVADNNSCTVRILPPWSSSGIFLKKISLIWNLPEEGYCFVSPSIFGKICPFESAGKEIYLERKNKNNKKLHEEDLNLLRPKTSYYGRVVVFEENGMKYPTPVIKYMRFGVKTYDMIMTYFAEGTGGVPLTGLQKGLNIKVIATGSGMLKSYVAVPIPSDFDVRTVSGIETVINLDKIFQEPENSLVYKAFNSISFRSYTPSAKILKMLEQEYAPFVEKANFPDLNVSETDVSDSQISESDESGRMYNVEPEKSVEDTSTESIDVSVDSVKAKIEAMRAKLSNNQQTN